MEPARTETLAFLAPGLLHQLGNVLFTIQGNAQAAGSGGDADRERLAIVAAAERGAESLRVLRYLLGDAAAAPAPAAALLGQLAELARIPVREARHLLELRPLARQVPLCVDPGDFCVAVLEALRSLVGILPTGLFGTLVLELSVADERQATVRVAFQPPSGTLPFPLALDELVGGLDRSRLGLRGRPEVRVASMGVELVFAGRAGSPPAEA